VGPLWSRLQKGESITLEGGKTVTPEEVMGTARKGRKFSFVTDTSYHESIPPQVSNSDLLICEAMFDSSLADSARDKRHLTAEQAGRIAREAGGVKKMGLIHFSPRYSNRELGIIKEEASREFSETFLCRDQMEVSIPHED